MLIVIDRSGDELDSDETVGGEEIEPNTMRSLSMFYTKETNKTLENTNNEVLYSTSTDKPYLNNRTDMDVGADKGLTKGHNKGIYNGSFDVYPINYNNEGKDGLGPNNP